MHSVALLNLQPILPNLIFMASFQTRLDKIVQKTAANRMIHGVVFHVQSEDKSIDLVSSAGNLSPDIPYYIASINKLMISAIVLRLCDQGILHRDIRICDIFPKNTFLGMFTYKGKDHSEEVTILHLLSQTAGLRCYLLDCTSGGKTNMKLILNGQDQSWPFEKMVSEMKQASLLFAPGTKGKCHYAETNFRLLGAIIEKVTGKKIMQVLADLFQELNMSNSFILPAGEKTHAPVYHRSKEISVQNYWTSTGADIAATAADQMIFLRSYFEGFFFPQNQLASLKTWNRIFFPFKYGTGLQQFYLPWIFAPFQKQQEIIGHCGSSGTVAFYWPLKKIFITGSVNQTGNPRLVFKAMMQIANCF
jgi:D-alanyl-D-alanine carboxypeptidase